MINDRLKILVVEDEIQAFVLIKYHINKIVKTPFINRVYYLDDFKNALINFKPDIIISDYKLPGFNGMDVLEYAKLIAPKTTFIFLTGTIKNETLADNSVLNGASAYILKKDFPELSKKLLPVFETVIKKNHGS